MSALTASVLERRVPLPARRALFERGFTMADFARASGYSYQHTVHVLAGRHPASCPFRKKLAEFLSVDEESLFPELSELTR